MSLSPRLRSRELRPALLALPLALMLSACGGGQDGDATGDATAPVAPGALAGSTQTAAPTPTPTPTPEPTDEGDDADATSVGGEEPQDPDEIEDPEVWATFTAEPGRTPGDVSEAFADDARLQAVLTFNAEFARAVTANDPRRAAWLQTLDESNYEALMDYLGDEFGKEYPGPLPFTPLDVGDSSEDGTASVQGCIISSGFALGPDGATGATITSIEYALVEDPAEPDAWIVHAMWAGAYDCSMTDVPARLW